jgi:hypothetical protein
MRHAPDNPKLFDGVLLQNAVAFAGAADTYAKADQSREWFVLYFLLAQSMELALKAFMVNQGATEAQLRRVGHDLTKALEQTEQAGLAVTPPLSATERPSIGLLSKWHSEQLTRYPLMQGYKIPRLHRSSRDLRSHHNCCW